jgi:hypothetical protein
MENVNHDLVQVLSVKLDSASRYELYKHDARGNPELQTLFDRLMQDDMRHIEMLRQAIVNQIASNAWK